MDLPTWMILVFTLLLGMRLGRLAERSKMAREEYTCPHGYDDSDKCPDCCH